MRLFFFTLFLLLAPIASHAAWYEDMPTPQETVKQEKEIQEQHSGRTLYIAVIGDDFLSGYKLSNLRDFGSTLERKLYGKYNIRIRNYLTNNGTTVTGLQALNKAIADKPDMVIIGLGYNDAAAQLPISATYTNMKTMVLTLKEKKIRTLLLGMTPPDNTNAEYKKKFSLIYSYLAKEHKLAIYPNYMKRVHGDNRAWLDDRIHPNQRGIESIVADVLPLVSKEIEAERAE